MLRVKTIRGSGELERYLKRLKGIGVHAEIGFFPGGKYPNGQSVATVAYRNETGAGGIPRRPFMARTVKKHQKEWIRGITQGLRGGKITEARARRVYETYAQVVQGEIKRTIADWSPSDPRPNSPATIKRKAARAGKARKGIPIDPNRALIDTGRMIRSVDYRVGVKK